MQGGEQQNLHVLSLLRVPCVWTQVASNYMEGEAEDSGLLDTPSMYIRQWLQLQEGYKKFENMGQQVVKRPRQQAASIVGVSSVQQLWISCSSVMLQWTVKLGHTTDQRKLSRQKSFGAKNG
jgi:hypothetical protein